jgi:hypothetical protein
MKKQRAFATLTEAEIDQIADWLRTRTYDQVLDLIAQPRPEGFALKISRKPLQLLHAKLYRLDKINTRIETAQKLTLADLDAINAGEKTDLAEEAHHAILLTVRDLALEGESTPAQLLALQRLADFPARAEIREQRLDLQTRRVALAERKQDWHEKLTAPPVPVHEDPEQVKKALWDLFGLTEAQQELQRAVGRPLPDRPHDAGSPFPIVSLPAKDEKSTRPGDAEPEEQPAPLPEPRPPLTLEERVNQYTVERYLEHRYGTSTEKVGKWRAQHFKTKMHWCPCGQNGPCPEHGDFNEYFWEASPVSSEYISSLRRCGLPYTNPFHLIHEQEAKEKAAREEKLEKEKLEQEKLGKKNPEKPPQQQNV